MKKGDRFLRSVKGWLKLGVNMVCDGVYNGVVNMVCDGVYNGVVNCYWFFSLSPISEIP